MPSKQINETFTNDLRYNDEVISLEDLTIEPSDESVPSSGYKREDLDMIWDVLRACYDLNDDHYIIMYLIYYLGFSYRKAGAVVGRVPSLVFLYEEQALHAARVYMGMELVTRKDPRDLHIRVAQLLNIPEIDWYPFTTPENGIMKYIENPNMPEVIQERFRKLYEERQAE